MTAPVRIHLHMEGQPQETAEAAALLLVSALKFCAQPETFPVFIEFTRRDNGDHDWVIQVMDTVSPPVLRGVEQQIAGGIVADFEAQQ